MVAMMSRPTNPPKHRQESTAIPRPQPEALAPSVDGPGSNARSGFVGCGLVRHQSVRSRLDFHVGNVAQGWWDG